MVKYIGLEIIRLTNSQPTVPNSQPVVDKTEAKSDVNWASQLVPLACLVGGFALYFLSNGTSANASSDVNSNIFVP